MQVTVTGRNTHVSNHMKQVATEKIEKVQRFFDRIQTMEVEFSEEQNARLADQKHTVEVTVTTKQHVLRAHASGADPLTAVEDALGKIESQVKRLKSKWVRRGSRVAGAKRVKARTSNVDLLPALQNGSAGAVESDNGYERDGLAQAVRISQVKRFAVKPMSPEEAVLQMQSLGHDFYLFVNPESEQTAVVYRRSDGTFGLIEPD